MLRQLFFGLVDLQLHLRPAAAAAEAAATKPGEVLATFREVGEGEKNETASLPPNYSPASSPPRLIGAHRRRSVATVDWVPVLLAPSARSPRTRNSRGSGGGQAGRGVHRAAPSLFVSS